MKVRIHRGAQEIGGNCIEVAAGPDRIVLDLGRPLSAGWDDIVPLPNVPGLGSPDPTLHGVVLSHPHLDHYGLADQLHPDVPVYLGAEASRVLEAAAMRGTRPPATPHRGHDGRGSVRSSSSLIPRRSSSSTWPQNHSHARTATRLT